MYIFRHLSCCLQLIKIPRKRKKHCDDQYAQRDIRRVSGVKPRRLRLLYMRAPVFIGMRSTRFDSQYRGESGTLRLDRIFLFSVPVFASYVSCFFIILFGLPSAYRFSFIISLLFIQYKMYTMCYVNLHLMQWHHLSNDLFMLRQSPWDYRCAWTCNSPFSFTSGGLFDFFRRAKHKMKIVS